MDIDEDEITRGFYAKACGLFVFSKIFRFIENETKGDVHVSDIMWRMNFTIEQEAEQPKKMKPGALPLTKPKFAAEVRLYAENPDDPNPE
jgi:hypothetical protein